jgi:hypothetical protein
MEEIGATHGREISITFAFQLMGNGLSLPADNCTVIVRNKLGSVRLGSVCQAGIKNC